MENPKLFISYSWSNLGHEEWVEKLASELRQSGVDVLFDKWELREGYDALVFMERMVNDPEVEKVIIVSDKKYVEKANDRDGGVGIETVIISKKLYEQHNQDKFAVVLREKDTQGKPYLPTYFNSKMYIDFCNDEEYIDKFEQLVRWVFNKPKLVKPEIGQIPDYINSENNISLGTSTLSNRLIDAISNGKPNASGLLSEYLDTFATNFEKFRLQPNVANFNERVIENINIFLSSRNEFVNVIYTLARYNNIKNNNESLHKFFECLIPYMELPEGESIYKEKDYDNYYFIIHELFLYTVAVLIKFEHFEDVDSLLEKEYFFPFNNSYGRKSNLVSFLTFRRYILSIDEYQQKIDSEKNVRSQSLRAKLLKERNVGINITFIELMQADFVLYLRSMIHLIDEPWKWYPESLLYATRKSSPFEIFARAESLKYFDKIKCMLRVDSVDKLHHRVGELPVDDLPHWHYETFRIYSLAGSNELGKKP